MITVAKGIRNKRTDARHAAGCGKSVKDEWVIALLDIERGEGDRDYIFDHTSGNEKRGTEPPGVVSRARVRIVKQRIQWRGR